MFSYDGLLTSHPAAYDTLSQRQRLAIRQAECSPRLDVPRCCTRQPCVVAEQRGNTGRQFASKGREVKLLLGPVTRVQHPCTGNIRLEILEHGAAINEVANQKKLVCTQVGTGASSRTVSWCWNLPVRLPPGGALLPVAETKGRRQGACWTRLTDRPTIRVRHRTTFVSFALDANHPALVTTLTTIGDIHASPWPPDDAMTRRPFGRLLDHPFVSWIPSPDIQGNVHNLLSSEGTS